MATHFPTEYEDYQVEISRLQTRIAELEARLISLDIPTESSGVDCTSLSKSAQSVFDEIKAHYPPDGFSRDRWIEDGSVDDNGWHDLKKAKDRRKLTRFYKELIGGQIVTSASGRIKRGRRVSGSAVNMTMLRPWIELVYLLEKLDFQIETMDFVD